jgi:thiol-disulfide isomerase/thioredoxin
MFAEYKSHFPESKNLALLRKAMSVRKTICVGKPAPDFSITTPEGKKMKLSDLKGKVVYLDFWSSGCVPCIGEMPAAKRLHEYFKGKPVAFVNVSLDAKEDVWKRAIKKYDVDGINTLEENETKSETAKKYGIIGVPSYFLIDKNGNFAVVEGINRPSDGEKLIAQIEKILN